ANMIQAIDKGSVHRICSGQVVLTLAVAVKELVENSVDAGATSVDIKLKEYGSECIEVSDNGSGVEEQNFKGLTLKHHTSKLQDFSDLVNVETFGFRGEALSSLCALSDLSVLTCHKDAAVGNKLDFDYHGNIKKQVPSPRQTGTTVILQNLFHTLPVRHREFQRNLKKEFAKMVQVLNGYCLINIGIRIHCTNQVGKGSRSVVVSTKGNSTIKENIVNIFGAKQLQQVLEFKQYNPSEDVCTEFGVKTADDTSDLFKLNGFISKCDHGLGRSSTDRQFIFINNRPCDSTKLIKVVNEVYHQYNRHQYPFLVLNINMEKTSVDVNVTPDKRQIFLEGEKLLLAVIKTSLIKLFEPTTCMMTLNQKKCLDQFVSRTSSDLNIDSKPSVKDIKLFLSPNKSSEESGDCVILEKKDKFSSEQNISIEIYNPTTVKTHNESEETLRRLEVSTLVTTDSCDIDTSESGISGSLTSESQSILSSQTFLDDSLLQTCEMQTVIKQKETVLNVNNLEQFVITQKETELNDDNQVQSVITQKETVLNDHQVQTVHVYKNHVSDINVSDSNKVHQNFETELVSSLNISRSTKRSLLTYLMPLKSISNVSSISFCVTEKDVNQEFFRSFRATISPTDNNSAEEELQREIKKEMFSQMKILGQFNLGFIITKLQDDLFIVDQHATDEKYNFEMLQKNTVLQSQKLIHPQCLELTASNETILVDNLSIFNQNGFEFVINEEAPPTQRIKLTSTPVSKNWNFGKEDIEELLFMLTDSPGTMCRPSRVRMMFASRSCRKAVMIGTALNKTQMKKLVCHMGEIEMPWNCPHGRPTMRHLFNLQMLPKL
ncbi:hypothetical protein LOTGIDRAFT_108533, partial [Lottia gigantea]